MGRKRSRRFSKTIGFKAFHDTDADIIAWWEALPEGDRSDLLRDLIRAAIAGSVAHKHEPATPMLRQISDDTAWLRAALTDLPGYLERLVSQVASSRPEASSTDSGTPPAAASHLDQDAVQRRKAKMRQNDW